MPMASRFTAAALYRMPLWRNPLSRALRVARRGHPGYRYAPDVMPCRRQRGRETGRGRIRCQVRSVPREKGSGKPNDQLVGGSGSLAGDRPPMNTVGSFRPYATTLRRAMPLDRPKSLRDEEVYAVAACVLKQSIRPWN
jgi:hypothetical protein